jgi:hypothetical protein
MHPNLTQSLAVLDRAITERISRENSYIRNVRQQLLQLLNQAGPCVGAAVAAVTAAGLPSGPLTAIQNELARLTNRLNDEQPFTTQIGSVDANVNLLMNPITPYIQNLRKQTPMAALSGGWTPKTKKRRKKNRI